MRVPEGVRSCYFGVLDELDDPQQALEAALEQLRVELEGDEAVEAVVSCKRPAGMARAGILLERRLQSDARDDIRRALNSVLGDKE